jgi:Ca2+-binding EF-hand superfamily protein
LDARELQKAMNVHLGVKMDLPRVGMVIDALDIDKDGLVSMDDFLYGHKLAHLGLVRQKFRATSYAVGRQDWNKLFRRYDRNSSGVLDFEEFRRAIRKDAKLSARDVTDTDLQDLFDFIDQDRSGSIDIDEFTKLLSIEPGSPRRRGRQMGDTDIVHHTLQCICAELDRTKGTAQYLFHSADADNSGYLDANELDLVLQKRVKLQLTKNEITQLIAAIDRDGNGKVSVAEFVSRIRRVKRDNAPTIPFDRPKSPVRLPKEVEIEPPPQQKLTVDQMTRILRSGDEIQQTHLDEYAWPAGAPKPMQPTVSKVFDQSDRTDSAEDVRRREEAERWAMEMRAQAENESRTGAPEIGKALDWAKGGFDSKPWAQAQSQVPLLQVMPAVEVVGLQPTRLGASEESSARDANPMRVEAPAPLTRASAGTVAASNAAAGTEHVRGGVNPSIEERLRRAREIASLAAARLRESKAHESADAASPIEQGSDRQILAAQPNPEQFSDEPGTCSYLQADTELRVEGTTSHPSETDNRAADATQQGALELQAAEHAHAAKRLEADKEAAAVYSAREKELEARMSEQLEAERQQRAQLAEALAAAEAQAAAATQRAAFQNEEFSAGSEEEQVQDAGNFIDLSPSPKIAEISNLSDNLIRASLDYPTESPGASTTGAGQGANVGVKMSPSLQRFAAHGRKVRAAPPPSAEYLPMRSEAVEALEEFRADPMTFGTVSAEFQPPPPPSSPSPRQRTFNNPSNSQPVFSHDMESHLHLQSSARIDMAGLEAIERQLAAQEASMVEREAAVEQLHAARQAQQLLAKEELALRTKAAETEAQQRIAVAQQEVQEAEEVRYTRTASLPYAPSQIGVAMEKPATSMRHGVADLLFAALDKNGDGVLDRSEMSLGLGVHRRAFDVAATRIQACHRGWSVRNDLILEEEAILLELEKLREEEAAAAAVDSQDSGPESDEDLILEEQAILLELEKLREEEVAAAAVDSQDSGPESNDDAQHSPNISRRLELLAAARLTVPSTFDRDETTARQQMDLRHGRTVSPKLAEILAIGDQLAMRSGRSPAPSASAPLAESSDDDDKHVDIPARGAAFETSKSSDEDAQVEIPMELRAASQSDLPAISGTSSAADLLFAALDRDGDGVITKEELTAGLGARHSDGAAGGETAMDRGQRLHTRSPDQHEWYSDRSAEEHAAAAAKLDKAAEQKAAAAMAQQWAKEAKVAKEAEEAKEVKAAKEAAAVFPAAAGAAAKKAAADAAAAAALKREANAKEAAATHGAQPMMTKSNGALYRMHQTTDAQETQYMNQVALRSQKTALGGTAEDRMKNALREIELRRKATSGYEKVQTGLRVTGSAELQRSPSRSPSHPQKWPSSRQTNDQADHPSKSTNVRPSQILNFEQLQARYIKHDLEDKSAVSIPSEVLVKRSDSNQGQISATQLLTNSSQFRQMSPLGKIFSPYTPPKPQGTNSVSPSDAAQRRAPFEGDYQRPTSQSILPTSFSRAPLPEPENEAGYSVGQAVETEYRGEWREAHVSKATTHRVEVEYLDGTHYSFVLALEGQKIRNAPWLTTRSLVEATTSNGLSPTTSKTRATSIGIDALKQTSSFTQRRNSGTYLDSRQKIATTGASVVSGAKTWNHSSTVVAYDTVGDGVVDAVDTNGDGLPDARLVLLSQTSRHESDSIDHGADSIIRSMNDGSRPAGTSSAADLLFAALDRDGDGVITKEELTAGLGHPVGDRRDRSELEVPRRQTNTGDGSVKASGPQGDSRSTNAVDASKPWSSANRGWTSSTRSSKATAPDLVELMASVVTAPAERPGGSKLGRGAALKERAGMLLNKTVSNRRGERTASSAFARTSTENSSANAADSDASFHAHAAAEGGAGSQLQANVGTKDDLSPAGFEAGPRAPAPARTESSRISRILERVGPDPTKSTAEPPSVPDPPAPAGSAAVIAWTVDKVGDWLADELKLEQYRGDFARGGIRGASLASLSDANLEELGVDRAFHRGRILSQVKKLLRKI